MHALNAILDTIQGWFALATGITMIIIVCGPMNPRKLPEKICLLSIGISLIGAWLRRLAKNYAQYDYDGEVLLFAEFILLVARFSAVTFGVIVIGKWAARCRYLKYQRTVTSTLPFGGTVSTNAKVRISS